MPRPRVVHIASIAGLRAAAPAWDDLWRRSDVALPTLRAELIAQWIEHFAPRAGFHALVVEDQGQWVAALPLVHRKLGRVIEAGTTPTNQWFSRGELLLDNTVPREVTMVDAVLDELVAGMGQLPWPLLWLEDVRLDEPHWKALREALTRAAVAADWQEQFRVGWIHIDHDWEACKHRWSRKHRQEMSRSARRLQRQGEVQFQRYTQLAPDEVEPLLRRGLEVEDRSWKGQAGTSVLRTPGMFVFFRRQAEQLARWGQLELDFLTSDGHPIAFAYGMNAKGVFHSCKVGYDPAYAAYGPGQLLRYYMLERLHGDPQSRAIDCMGRISDAHRRWKPVAYAMGRLVVAPVGPASRRSARLLARVALHAYRHWWPLVGHLRRNRVVGGVSDGD